MQKVCGNIFEDRKRRNDSYIGIHAKSFKSIGMLAYRVSFCYAVDLKFVQMLS